MSHQHYHRLGRPILTGDRTWKPGNWGLQPRGMDNRLKKGFSAAFTTNLIRKLSNNETMAIDVYITMRKVWPFRVGFTFEERYAASLHDFSKFCRSSIVIWKEPRHCARQVRE